MMSTIRARVQNGRLIVDEPTDIPEGTELDLVIDDAGDSLDEAERAALHAAIGQAWASFQEGKGGSPPTSWLTWPSAEPSVAMQVVVAARAEAQIRTINAWWRRNRNDAPDPNHTRA